MTSILINGPATEPIGLAEAKSYLRVTHTGDDELIGTLIAAARTHVETITRKAMITQQWRVIASAWPSQGLRLPIAPFQSLISIDFFDDDGVAQNWPLAEVDIEKDTGHCTLYMPKSAQNWPQTRDHNGIEVTFQCGFGATATDVPNDLRLAMLRLVGHWFEHREAVLAAGGDGLIPPQFDRLVGRYCEVRL